MRRHEHATHNLAEVLKSWAELTTVALFAITFLVQPYRIPSGSMEKTLLVGDFVLANKQVFAPAGGWRWLLPYREPTQGAVVVFLYPVDPGKLLVKRVVAVGGDTVRLRHGDLLRNGRPVAEPYAHHDGGGRSHFRDEFPSLLETDPEVQARWWIALRHEMRDDALPVPAQRLFVMGDNRNDSIDSRFWGFVPRGSVLGEPLLVSFSVNPSKRGWRAVRWRRTGMVVR